MPDIEMRPDPGGIDLFPEFVDEVMPHVTSASESVLHTTSPLFYIACGRWSDRPDLVIRLLSLCDGDLDLALKSIEGSIYVFPVLAQKLELVLDGMDEHMARWPVTVRRKLISYFLNNADAIRGFDRLLSRYQRHSPIVTGFVIEYPTLAGTDPDVLLDAACVSDGWSSTDGGNTWMHEFIQLVCVFGKRWRDWVDLCDPGIEGAELIGRVHVAAHVAGVDGLGLRYWRRSDFKGLGSFLINNRRRLPGYVLRLISSNWKECGETVMGGNIDDAIELAVRKRFSIGMDGAGDLDGLTTEDLCLGAASGLGWTDTSRMRRVKMEAVLPPPDWSLVGAVGLGKYEGVFLERGDHTVPYIGSIVGCCQHLGGVARLCAVHSGVSPKGALFVVRPKDLGDDPIAVSWVWSNDDVVVFDNIEGPVARGEDSRLNSVVLPIYREAASRMVMTETASSVMLGVDKCGVDMVMLDEMPVWPHVWPTFPEDYLEIQSSWGSDLGMFESQRETYPTDSCLRKIVLAGAESADLPINEFATSMDDPADVMDVRKECRRLFPNGGGGPCGPSAVASLVGGKVADVMGLWPSVQGRDFPWVTTTGAMMSILDAVGLDAELERIDAEWLPDPGVASIICVRPAEIDPPPKGAREAVQWWHWIARVGEMVFARYRWEPVELIPWSHMRVRRIIKVRRRSPIHSQT